MERFAKEWFTDEQLAAYAYFKDHLDEWHANPLYRLKYAVIHNDNLEGIFDTFPAAFRYALSHFPRTSFIIQQIITEDDVVSFYSPVIA